MEIETDNPCMAQYGVPHMMSKQDCLNLLDQFLRPQDYDLAGSDESPCLTVRVPWRGGAVVGHCAINWTVIYREIDILLCEYVHIVLGGLPSPYETESPEGGKDLGIAFSQD